MTSGVKILKGKIVSVLLIIAIATILRAPYATVPFFNVDEALIAVMADTVLDGNVLYRDAWEHQTPLSYYIYALVFLFFGKNNMTAIHLFAIGWIALTALMIFKLADYLYGDRNKVGFLAGVLYVIFSTTYESGDVLAVNTEIFMVLPLTAAIYYLLKAEKTAKLPCFILSGILCALGAMTKQTGGLVLPAMLTYLILTPLLQKKEVRWGETFKKCLLIMLGFSLVIGVCIVYFWLNNALKDFFYLTVKHPYQYSTAVDLGYLKYRFKVSAASIVVPNLLLWGMAGITTCSIILRAVRGYLVKDVQRRWNEEEVPETLLVLWLFASLLAISLGGRFFGHYYIQTFPALSILAAYGVLHLPGKLFARAFPSPLLKGVIWIGVCVGILIPVTKYQKINYERFILHRDNPQLVNDKFEASFIPVADYIRKSTAPDDYIFVWGFCPQIYVLAHRRPASRFIFCNFLTGRMTESPRHFDPDLETSDWITPGSWELLLDDLRIRKPRFIIDASSSNYLMYAKYPIEKYNHLRKFLEMNYRLEKEISSMRIYRLKKGNVA